MLDTHREICQPVPGAFSPWAISDRERKADMLAEGEWAARRLAEGWPREGDEELARWWRAEMGR